MTIGLIEAAVDAVKTFLSANMAAKLDALDAEYGDFALDDIVAWHVAELPEVPEYPAVFILGEYSTVEEEGAGWIEADHVLTVHCIATDQDAERLRRRLYRYIRAVVELLKGGRASLGYVINFNRLEFSPMYGREGTFLSDARLLVRFKKSEIA